MESVAATRTRLHFQFFGTTLARLLSVSGVDRITKYGALQLYACKCGNRWIPGIYSFVSKKRLSPLDCMLLALILSTEALLLHGWCLLCTNWFICRPDFSCCMDEISLRMSINSSQGSSCARVSCRLLPTLSILQICEINMPYFKENLHFFWTINVWAPIYTIPVLEPFFLVLTLTVSRYQVMQVKKVSYCILKEA